MGCPDWRGRERESTSWRKGYVHIFAFNLLWGTLIHEGTTMRWKLIHNLGHRFSPQTPLSSKFIARCSLSSLSGSETLPQKLGNPHGDASWGFPIGLAGKEPPAYEGDMGNTGSISVSAPRAGSGTPLQYSCLKIPWTEEPGRLQSTGPQRVRHSKCAHCTHARVRAHTHTHTHTHGMSAMKLMPWGSLISFYTYCGFLFLHFSLCLYPFFEY